MERGARGLEFENVEKHWREALVSVIDGCWWDLGVRVRALRTLRVSPSR